MTTTTTMTTTKGSLADLGGSALRTIQTEEETARLLPLIDVNMPADDKEPQNKPQTSSTTRPFSAKARKRVPQREEAIHLIYFKLPSSRFDDKTLK